MARVKKPTPQEPQGQQPERTNEQSAAALVRKVRMFYDLQMLRMQAAGRGATKADDKQVQLHPYDVELLNKRAYDLAAAETAALRDVEEHLKTIPFYRDVLSDKEKYKGIGPTMAGVILSSFDIYRASTPSKFWKFAGLAPIQARRCRFCHVVVEEQEDGSWKHAVKWKTKRAGKVEESNGQERAVDGEESDRSERADDTKVSSGEERARAPEASVTVKRAVLAEESKPRERADLQAKTVEKERAKSTEQPAEEERPKCKYERLTLEQTYPSAKAEKPQKGVELHYNKWLRAKLIGVLGSGLLKCNSPWRKFYDDYKHRKQSEGWGISDGHRHMAATRYMVKMLLLDIWIGWRKNLGLPLRVPYQEEYLKHKHG